MKTLILTLALFVSAHTLHAKEHEFTTSDGVKLYVKVAGSGTPLLYIHGGPGSGSYWFEEFFGEFMEKHFTVVYLDQRGVGRSESPVDGNFSMDRMTKDFEELREMLGYEKWFTMGHSFGGLLQMGYAERYPEAHSGMLMINCTLNIKETCCESWFPKAAEFLGEKYLSCEEDSIPVLDRINYFGNKLREQDLFWKMAYENPENEQVMNNTYKDIPDFNYDLGRKIMSIEDYWRNFKPISSQIKFPVLFFYGSRDWMIGPDHYLDIQFPNMTLWESEVGHMPFLESKEDLQKAILTYLEKQENQVD